MNSPEGSRTDTALIEALQRLAERWRKDADNVWNKNHEPLENCAQELEYLLDDYNLNSPDAQVGAIGLHALHAEPVALDYARWHLDHSWFYRDLTDVICKQVAEGLNHFDQPDLSLDRMSAAQFEAFTGASIDRFRNEARFRARVDSLTYVIVRAARAEIETALAAPQPPSAPSQSGEVAQPVTNEAELLARGELRQCDTDICIICKGAGEYLQNVEAANGDPQDATMEERPCPYCDGTGEVKRKTATQPPNVVQLQGELARLREDAIKQEEEWQEVCRENDKLRDQLAALQGNSP